MGVTLIEVLITIAIVSIIMLAFLGVFSSSFKTIFLLGDKDVAINLASDIMEVLYEKQSEKGYSDVDSIKEILSGEIEDKNSSSNTNKIRYDITEIESSSGFKVELFVEYRKNKEISIFSFLRGSD